MPVLRLQYGHGLLEQNHPSRLDAITGCQTVEVDAARERLPRACRGVPGRPVDAGVEGFVDEHRHFASEHIVHPVRVLPADPFYGNVCCVRVSFSTVGYMCKTLTGYTVRRTGERERSENSIVVEERR